MANHTSQDVDEPLTKGGVYHATPHDCPGNTKFKLGSTKLSGGNPTYGAGNTKPSIGNTRVSTSKSKSHPTALGFSLEQTQHEQQHIHVSGSLRPGAPFGRL